MQAERRRRVSACAGDWSCLFRAAAWSGAERDLLAEAVERGLASHADWSAAVSDDGARAQLGRELAGINHILDVYGLGAAPRYPEIDGPGALPRIRLATDALALAEAAKDEPLAVFDPGAELALALLDASGRTDAAAFEPLDEHHDGPASARLPAIDWLRYPYTAIIVPGVGPDDISTPLSARGKLNVRLAAARFLAGEAPFIIVTGGTVHPRGTQHVEALEMRMALIERFGIPTDCIVVEPYARHTTTNLRNVSRRLIALGAPLDRDALIVTNPQQSRSIESTEFAARNQAELGYLPGIVGARSSPTDLAFRPAKASLRVDPMDPLDP